jgi:hypothetical protein
VRARLASFAWAPSAALLVTGLVFMVLTFGSGAGQGSTAAESLVLFSLAAVILPVGALVSSRRPGNPLGWVFAATSFFWALGFAGGEYGIYAILADPGALPGGAIGAWFTYWFWLPGVGLPATALLLLFPDGRLPSRRWRPVLVVAGLGLAIGTAGGALAPGEIDRETFGGLENPFGVGSDVLEIIVEASIAATAVCALLSIASLIVRLRRARGAEREQLKWVLSLFVVCAVLLLIGFGTFEQTWGSALLLAGIGGLPISTGIAILKHGLWDIDVIVRKTLVYGAVSALLAGLYFGVVIGLQQVFSSFAGASDLAIAGSTLAVAALFRPVRSRIQALVDRRFYRRRYDAQRTLEAFSARLREEVDLEALAAELRAVVLQTMQPAHVTLWLRRPEVTP